MVRGEEAAASEHVDRLTRLATECSFSLWHTFAEVCAGRLLVSQGEGSAGVARMRSAAAGWQGAGMLLGVPILAVVLADGCLHAARQLQSTEEAAHARLLAGGLAAVDQGLDLAEEKGARLLEAELHRLRGELLWARREHGAAEAAEACFRTAIAVAADQNAVTMELRAAMSLVRLLMGPRGANAAELATARDQLRTVYGRFTEGWVFPDLREAAELLCSTPGFAPSRPGR